MTNDLESLTSRAARGMFWALLATLGVRLASLLSLAVLARLLSPAEFGLAAFALVFLTYAETVGDLGAATALIYWPERRVEAARAAFWINVGMAVVWFAVAWILAPGVAEFFHQPAAASVLRLLALSFPLKAVAASHDALCQKDLKFRERLAPEVAMAVTKALVSVALALAGLGVWSLAWGQLAGLAARALALWRIEPWRPVGPVPRDLVRPLLAYGRGVVAVNVLAAVVHHADLVVVGRRLGAEALGLYQVAAKLPEMTVALLVWVAAKVLFPTFAQLQAERPALRRLYLGSVRTMALLALPAALAMIVLARPLTAALFGGAWAAAAPILQALAAYSALRAIGSPAGDVLKASGRPGLLARLGLLKAAVLVPALLLASSRGATALAATLAAVTGATGTLNLVVGCRAVSAGPRELARALRPSLLPAGAVTVVLLAWTRATSFGALATLAGGLAAAAVAYGWVVRRMEPGLWARARALLAESWSGWGRRSLVAEVDGR